MPRGPAPAWRMRKAVIVNGVQVATAADIDNYVRASVEQAGGIGKHNEHGHYADLVIRGLATREEAAEWSRALYRCAHYLSRTEQLDVAMSAKTERDKGGYKITFKAVDKTLARKHVLEKYGPDRSKWPYDPRKRGRPEG